MLPPSPRVADVDETFLSCTPSPIPYPLTRNTALRKALPAVTRTDNMLKEMMISLHTAGLLTRSTETADIGGFKRTWEVHRLTRAGEDWLAKDEAARAPVMLPMPQVMIDAQREKKRRAAETVAELVSAGVQMDQVPAEEVEDGGGEVMTVLTMWVRTLQRLRSPETSSQGVFLTQPCSSASVPDLRLDTRVRARSLYLRLQGGEMDLRRCSPCSVHVPPSLSLNLLCVSHHYRVLFFLSPLALSGSSSFTPAHVCERMSASARSWFHLTCAHVFIFLGAAVQGQSSARTISRLFSKRCGSGVMARLRR